MPQNDILLNVGYNTQDNELLSKVSRVANQAQGILNKGMVLNHAGITLPLGKMSKSANEFDKSLAASHARVLAFGASAGIIFGVERAMVDLVKSTIMVEKELISINSILRVSSEGLTKFGNSLFAIAKDTGQTFETVAKAATELSRQGLGAEETLKRTHDALILTRLSGLDAVSAVESLTAAMNSFNQTTLTSTQIINKMANVDAAFAVSSKDLAEAIKRVGSTAEDTGVNFDQLMALVTAAKQITQRDGPVIGNSLKTIFQRLERPETLSFLRSLKAEVIDLTSGEALPGPQLLINLAKVYEGLGGALQNQVVQLSAGVYQANIFRAILSDLAKENGNYARALKVSSDASNEAIQRNEEYNKSLSALLNATRANIVQLGSEIGNITAAPLIRSLLESFNSLFDSFKQIQGSGIGNILESILKGIGQFISGPGLATAGILITKLLVDAVTFSKEAFKSVIGINTVLGQQAALQKIVNQTLVQNPGLLDAVLQRRISILGVEEAILNTLRQQNVLQAGAAKLSGPIASGLFSRGVTIKGGDMNLKGAPPRFAAFDNPMSRTQEIPNFAPSFRTLRRFIGYEDYAVPKGAVANTQGYADIPWTRMFGFSSRGGNPLGDALHLPTKIQQLTELTRLLGSPERAKRFLELREMGKAATAEKEFSEWSGRDPSPKLTIQWKNLPNFNKFSDAISREIASGIPSSSVRMGQDSRLRSSFNPAGIGIYNTIDEPRGLGQGISRALSQGKNPKTYNIPNFADPKPFSFSGLVPSSFNQLLKQEQLKIVEGIKNRSIEIRSLEEIANKAKSLGKSFSASEKSIKRLEQSFTRAYYERRGTAPTARDIALARSITGPSPQKLLNAPPNPLLLGPASRIFYQEDRSIVDIFKKEIQQAQAKITTGFSATAPQMAATATYLEQLKRLYPIGSQLSLPLSTSSGTSQNSQLIPFGAFPQGRSTLDQNAAYQRFWANFNNANRASLYNQQMGLPGIGPNSLTPDQLKEQTRQAKIVQDETMRRQTMLEDLKERQKNRAANYVLPAGFTTKETMSQATQVGRFSQFVQSGKFGQGMFALSFLAPMIAQVVADSIDTTTKKGRVKQSLTLGLGDLASFGMLGGMVGGLPGGLIGAGVGAGIGGWRTLRQQGTDLPEFEARSAALQQKFAQQADETQRYVLLSEKIKQIKEGTVRAKAEDLASLELERAGIFNQFSPRLQSKVKEGYQIGGENTVQNILQNANQIIQQEAKDAEIIKNLVSYIEKGSFGEDRLIGKQNLETLTKGFLNIRGRNDQPIGTLLMSDPKLRTSIQQYLKDASKTWSEKTPGVWTQPTSFLDFLNPFSSGLRSSPFKFDTDRLGGFMQKAGVPEDQMQTWLKVFESVEKGGVKADKVMAEFANQLLYHSNVVVPANIKAQEELNKITTTTPTDTLDNFQKRVNQIIQRSNEFKQQNEMYVTEQQMKGEQEARIWEIDKLGFLDLDRDLSIKERLEKQRGYEEEIAIKEAKAKSFGIRAKPSALLGAFGQDIFTDIQSKIVNSFSRTTDFSQFFDAIQQSILDTAKRYTEGTITQDQALTNVQEWTKVLTNPSFKLPDDTILRLKQALEEITRSFTSAENELIISEMALSNLIEQIQKRVALEQAKQEIQQRTEYRVLESERKDRSYEIQAKAGIRMTEGVFSPLEQLRKESELDQELAKREGERKKLSATSADERVIIDKETANRISEINEEFIANQAMLIHSYGEKQKQMLAAGRIFGSDYAQEMLAVRNNKILNPEIAGAYRPLQDTAASFTDQFRSSIQDNYRMMNEGAAELALNLKSSFKSAFMEFANGAKTAKEALRDLGISFLTNVLGKVAEIGFSNLVGGTISAIGLGWSKYTRGYAEGGKVQGSGTRDNVPAKLTPGEYVIKKAAVQKYGEDLFKRLNMGGFVKFDKGGAVSLTMRNRYLYDDPLRPTKGTLDVDPLLTNFALTDENNPQNQLRMGRESELMQYLKEKEDYENAKKDAMAQWKQAKKQRLISAYIAAGVQLAGAGIQAGIAKYTSSPAYMSRLQNAAVRGDSAASAKLGGLYARQGDYVSASQWNNVARSQQNGNYTIPSQTIGGYNMPSRSYRYVSPHLNSQWGFSQGGFVKFASGGFAGKDNIPALLMNREYVIRRPSVEKYGVDFFNRLNKGEISRFASGGVTVGESINGTTNESNNKLQDSLLKLITSTDALKDKLDKAFLNTTKIGNSVNSQVANPTTSPINVYSSISIQMGANGEVKSDKTTQNTDAQKPTNEQGRALGQQLENAVIKILIEQSRPGGLLRNNR